MSNELTNVSSEEMSETTQDYIDALNQLKSNSVEREKYDKLRAENKRLLDSLVNGQSIEKEVVVEKPNIDELRKNLFNSESNNNLEYISNALKLRKALIENGESDPFLPYGNQIMPTEEDIKTANRVGEILAECVEYAQGDSAVFTNELSRRTLDVKIR